MALELITSSPNFTITTVSGISPNVTNGTTENVSSLSIDNLYPAIIQCFAIILIGYVAGRANWITVSQGNGIGHFVGKFCLPALLFKSMVELKFDQVNWYFLLGIAISKTIVFVVVAVISLLIHRPRHYGIAGLFGIFATQSNDFALGYPILKAIYSENNPEYLQYIYLIAPISLVFLNPIGFTMLEVHGKENRGTCRLVLHVFKDVISNPIVFMVIIGIIGNFVFKQNIPTVLGDILEVLGNAYSASALFYLGLSLVGKLKDQFGFALIVPMLLIATKTLLLPLIMWQVIGALELSEENESRSLSMFGFLYGTFPTAPSVFLYASHFSVAQDIIATGMVACTFLSAPLMFASAKMLTVVVNSEMDYDSLLTGTSFDLSTICLVTNIWTFIVLLLGKKHLKMPHQFLLYLVPSQVLICVGTIMYKYSTSVSWIQYTQFVISIFGDFTSRCFTAVLSCVIYLLHRKSHDFVIRMRKCLLILAVGFPVICISILMVLTREDMSYKDDNAFHTGATKADALSVVVIGSCSVLNITFLVLHQRIVRRSSQTSETHAISDKISYTTVNDDVTFKSIAHTGSKTNLISADCLDNQHSVTFSNKSVNYGSNNEDYTVYWDDNEDKTSARDDVMAEDIECSMSMSTRSRGTRSPARYSEKKVQNNNSDVRKVSEESKDGDRRQTTHGKFLILLIFSQISMLLSLFLCTWRLFNDSKSGIYIETEFLGIFLNYGQNIVVFALFGFDVQTIIRGIIKRWRKLVYNVENVNIQREDLLIEEQQLCDQFIKYHLDRCTKDIVSNRKHRLKKYDHVFTGSSFCDWLLEAGLCKYRKDAIIYGQTLLKGKTIKHVTEEHNFHDMPYFYRFMNSSN